MKFSTTAKKHSKVGSKLYRILNKPSNCQIISKSGEILPNLVTLADECVR